MVAVPLGAAPRKSAPKPAVPAEEKLIQSCDAHKFEAVVDTTGSDGQPHKSKLKLCGVEGQSDAEWISTLKDAVNKLEANKQMAPATRDQAVAAIKAEIARLSIVGAAIPLPKREAEKQGVAPLSRDYAALPPLPAAPAEAAPLSPPPPAPLSRDYAALSALPAPVTPSVATPRAPIPTATAVPRLKIECENPTDLGGPAPCAGFERETRVTITADGDIPDGTALEFVRNGAVHGNLALAGLGRGNKLQSSLPQDLCAGFGAGRLELRVVEAGGAQVIRSEGTYTLRC